MTYARGAKAAILPTSRYERQVGRLLSTGERDALEVHIATQPDLHPVIPGTGGVRKARWGRQGRGKRGGVRVPYFFVASPSTIVMLSAYAKGEKEDLTGADKVAIKKAAEHFKRSRS